jgi:hypothetical protein
LERRRHDLEKATSAVAADAAAVNALLLVASAAIASAVFAAVAAAEGLPVVVGVLLPWFVLVAFAVWWLRESATSVRRHQQEQAEFVESARRAAVGLLLADSEQPRARLESAAALLLDPHPTEVAASRFLSRSDELPGKR